MSGIIQTIGRSVPNQEGNGLLCGEGQFTDDVHLADALYLCILRSPVAQARLTAKDIAAAQRATGVHAIHLGEELAGLGTLPINTVLPLSRLPAFPILATGTVCAIGQPVAAVLATSPECAADSVEAITLDFEEFHPSVGTPPLAEKKWCTKAVDDKFAQADHVVTTTLSHPVLAPSPMEPRAVAVQYHPDSNSVTIWHSTQTPHRSRSALAEILGVDASRLRVIAPDVGGAFGMKGSIYPEEVLAVWAALHHKRNIRWTATRSEEFLSATHGRGLTSRGELALDRDGRFLALRAEIDAPLGHWLPNSGLIPAWNAARVLPGGYRITEVDITTSARLTAHPPRGLYRGAGRPEANMLLERLVDQASQATGIDPIELRQRNLLKAEELPYATATGNLLDSGDYQSALTFLNETGAYRDALNQRDAIRQTGGLAGVGLGFYVEPSGEGWESARVTLHQDRAEIFSGSSAQGQWRKTAYAQIAADALNLPLAAVSVQFGDTGTCPEGIGALASRSTSIGGSAVLNACRETLRCQQKGASYPVTAEVRYENDGQAWGYGLCMAQLVVDRDTGQINLQRLVCIDDTGTVINPDLVKGQLIGGLVQGIGEALCESLQFDDDGQLLTGSLMDYALPRASDVPLMELHSIKTPSPMNILGAKGVGEAGTIAAPPAILNAALDALRPIGVSELTMPLTPCKVWTAMQNTQTGNLP